MCSSFLENCLAIFFIHALMDICLGQVFCKTYIKKERDPTPYSLCEKVIKPLHDSNSSSTTEIIIIRNQRYQRTNKRSNRYPLFFGDNILLMLLRKLDLPLFFNYLIHVRNKPIFLFLQSYIFYSPASCFLSRRHMKLKVKV